MATDTTNTDADPALTYEIIERDTVPAPAPHPDDTLQQRITDLLKWLQPTDYLSPGNEFTKHLHSYIPGTHTWLDQSPQFSAWSGLTTTNPPNTNPADASINKILHIRGVAGSGKSVLAAHTIRRLQQAGNVVLFFFFRQIVDRNHTARSLVRDFAAQLLPHSPELVEALTRVSRDQGVGGNEMGVVWPELAKVMEGMGGRVVCVADALDEMDEGDFEGMVRELVALGTGTGEEGVRVLMTSRPLPYIEKAVEGREGVVRVRLDPVLLSPDVARYVDGRMAALDPPLSDDTHELVKQTICERANGLFLHARLMADNLAEGLHDGRITEESLPESLDRLPRTLRAVYEDMLKEHARRSGVTAEQQAQVLMCVTHARRPLRLIELGSLLSRMLGVPLGRGKDLVRAGCGRLLELLEDETVSVIHHSFTEFLHDSSRKDDRDTFPVLDDETSHATLAVLLMEYLDGCEAVGDRRAASCGSDSSWGERDKLRTDMKVRHPLASYAAGDLFFHMSKVPPGTSATRVLAALDSYLAPDKLAFQNFLLMDWSDPTPASFNIFHLITSVSGCESIPVYVLEHFAERHPELVDIRDSDGLTPLAHAVDSGNDDFAVALLARGADPTSSGNDGLTPLHRAVEHGFTDTVQLLLDAGVDPLIKTLPVLRVYNRYEDEYEEFTEEEAEEQRETALSYAFRGRHHKVIDIFMPFIPPHQINSCFHRVDTVENVKTILKTGKVAIDCLWSGKTKLHEAARMRNLELIKLLLEHGADPKRRCDTDRLRAYDGDITTGLQHPHCERGSTVLHAFAGLEYDRKIVDDREEAAQCLRVLIEAGADVNAVMDEKGWGGQNMTPLHLAVQKTETYGVYWGSMDQSEEILTELLLSAGADPNAKTKNGNTPLHLANPEKLRVLEILVEHGADINAVNSWGRPPLLEMIHRLALSSSTDKIRPNVKVFNRLLELGADVHTADHEGNTIFHYIMGNINSFENPKLRPFIEGLLRAGADLNRKNNKGQPPLWHYDRRYSAVDGRDEDLLRALIAAGMDINACDNEGRNVLWGFAEQYSAKVETVAKFIRLGADPKTLTHDGRTLLHSATGSGPDLFRCLLSTGADPTLPSHDGTTILHAILRLPYASHGPNITATRENLHLLLDAGAPPLALNSKKQSVLHLATDQQKLELILSTPAFNSLDVNAYDTDGLTPLHHVVPLGEEAVGRLIRAGADPTLLAANPTNLSPLHIAAREGKDGVVGVLLAEYRKRGVVSEYVNHVGGEDGGTPLHYACRVGRAEAVWLLLREGADVGVGDGRGLSAMHALATCGLEVPVLARNAGDIVGMLKRAGGDVNAEVMVEVGGEVRRVTPLDVAVEKGCWAMARWLIAHGAEPRDSHRLLEDFVLATDKDKAAEKARETQAGVPRGALGSSRGNRGRDCRWRGRWAACPGAMPLVEGSYIISGGQDILDFKAEDNNSDDLDIDKKINAVDALYSVLRDGDYDTIKEYAQLGGDLLEPDHYRDKITFLHHLVEDGHVDLLEYFGDKVVEFETQKRVQEVDESSTAAGTLLGTICKQTLPSLHMVELLVDKLGVDANTVYNHGGNDYTVRGGTAVHILARGDRFWQVEALEYLLSKEGVDIEARDKRGRTPLLVAIGNSGIKFWHEETVRVLLRHGANANAKVETETGWSSALELSDDPGITKLLLEHGASIESSPDILSRVIRRMHCRESGIVKVLLEAGVDPNELPPWQGEKKDKNDESIQDGNADLEYTKTKLDLRYPLHEAARPTTWWYPAFDYEGRQRAIMDLLISHGADPYAPYPDGGFVFQAIVEDRGRVDSLLPGLSQTNCNRKGRHGRTLLASACIPTVPIGPDTPTNRLPTVMVDLIHALLASGADPLIIDNQGRTPLHWLSTFPNPFTPAHRAAFTALTSHAPTAINARDSQGFTSFHLALTTYSHPHHHTEPDPSFAIHQLLSSGADPTIPDPVTGNSPLHTLAPRLIGESTSAAATAELFRELATTCIDINARNAAGETALFALAATVGWRRKATDSRPTVEYTTHAAALEVFVDLGADLKAVDKQGRTVLHVTAGREVIGGNDRTRTWGVTEDEEDIEELFERLMELGVDPRAEDGELRTAIDVAVAKGLDGVVGLFSEEGRRQKRERREKKEAEGGDSGSDSSSSWGDLLY